jgi:hypothetical protein
VSDGVISSRVIAQRDPVELIEQRDDHTRVWEIEKEVETTQPDGTRTVDTVRSYIHEKGSGLCYRDASGNYVPSVAEWREVPDGFVIDRCGYWLSVGKTIGSGLRYIVDGHELLLGAAYLMISDGAKEAHLAVLNPNGTGFIVPGSPSVVRFPSAFGPGYDLEYVAEKGGFHQNLIIATPPKLPDGFDPSRTGMYLYTEMNLDQYLAASGLKVLVDGEEIDASAPDLLSPPSIGGCISFHRPAASPGEARALVHAFGISSVADTSAPGAVPNETAAQRWIMKDRSTRRSYLVESLPLAYLTEKVSFYPVIWDYYVVTEPISGGTWEPRYTYWVTDNISIEDVLTVLPGTTVKLNPSKKISILSNGTVVAKGEPYNYITFTKASDSNCGEPIPGAPSGPWDTALELQARPTDDSAIQYCKFGHGFFAIYILRTLKPENPIAHNIFDDVYVAMRVESCSATAQNNLMTYCSYCGVYVSGAGEVAVTNSTIDHIGYTYNMGGIWDGGCSSRFTATDNLFSNCATGIYSATPGPVIHHNRFYQVTTHVQGRQNDLQETLGNNPYSACAVGNFFLDPANSEFDTKLKDKGSRSAQDAGVGSGLFTVYAPLTVTATEYTTPQTWSQEPHDVAESLVDIGYHHCRTDVYVVPNDLPALTVKDTASTQGRLTIQPGVAVGIRGDKYLMVTNGGELVSVGDPGAGGLNLFTNGKSLSMNIESPGFGVTGVNPCIAIDSSASEDTSIQFTRTMWMGWGILINLGRHLSQPIRDNIFSLSYMGIHAGLYSGNTLFNNLIHENVRGVYAWGNGELANCTFDRNQTGLEVGADAGQKFTIRDSLFTKNNWDSNSRGILIDSGTGQIVSCYNAFWENAHDISPEEPLGPGSQKLSSTPYAAGLEEAWRARYRLNQISPVVDAGSCLAISLWAYPDNRRTTRADAVCDLGMVDIGFHFYSFVDTDGDGMDDAWETYWFGGLSQGKTDNPDGDILNNWSEYQSGLNPSSDDTDGDGRKDGVDSYPLTPAFDKGPYLQNTRYVSGQGSGMTVMCETPVNNVLKVRYRKPPASWASKGQTGRVSPEAGHQVHEIEISGLDPDSTYEYEVACDFCYARGDPAWTFLTAPSGSIPFRFVVYGDDRTYPADHQKVIQGILSKHTAENPVRFVINVGDLVTEGGVYSQWKPQFFDPASDLHKKIAIFEALGNHEYYLTEGSRVINEAARAKYIAFFDLPEGQDGAAPTERWYTFDHARCRFICLDTNLRSFFESNPPSNQYNWLAGANGVLPRAKTDKEVNHTIDRIFVFFHEPPYSGGSHGGDPGVETVLVSEFHKYHVDILFSGHDHDYERIRKTMDGWTVKYIVTGGGGAELGAVAHPPQYQLDGKAVQEAWYAKNSPPGGPNEDAYHYCVLDVNGSSLEFNVYKWNGVWKDGFQLP